MAQRCRCDTTGVTYTGRIWAAFRQSLYAHVLPAHVGDDDGRGGRCQWREGPRFWRVRGAGATCSRHRRGGCTGGGRE
eukprot:2881073-Prorocentrum_lima.AAC.1